MRVKHIFEVAVLPELLGRWFSRLPERISMTDSASLPSPAQTPASSGNNVHESSPSTSSGANHCEVVSNTSPGMHRTDR